MWNFSKYYDQLKKMWDTWQLAAYVVSSAGIQPYRFQKFCDTSSLATSSLVRTAASGAKLFPNIPFLLEKYSKWKWKVEKLGFVNNGPKCAVQSRLWWGKKTTQTVPLDYN